MNNITYIIVDSPTSKSAKISIQILSINKIQI